MAFNPLKKINVQAEQAQSFAALEAAKASTNIASGTPTTEPAQNEVASKSSQQSQGAQGEQQVSEENVVVQETLPSPHYFEGASLEELESTGINTMSALTSAATPKATAHILTESRLVQAALIHDIIEDAQDEASQKAHAELKQEQIASDIVVTKALEVAPPVAKPVASVAKPAPVKAAEIPEEQHVQKTAPQTDEQRRLEKQARFRALKDLVNDIQVNLVMDELGASTNEDKTRGKRKLDGVGNFSVSGQQWYNLNFMGTKNAGGVGSVSFIQHYLAMNAGCSLYDEESYRKYFAPSVYWLSEKFGEAVNSDDIKATMDDMQRIEKKDKIFSPPPADDSVMEAVKKYLMEERFIPEAMIDKQVREGKLYGAKLRNYIGAYEDYKRDPDPQFVDVPVAVFIAKAKTIAELRSIDPAYPIKRLAGGATRSHGFTVVHEFDTAENKMADFEGVSVVEAAIDAMSYGVFYPKRFVISSAGVNAEFAVKCAVITLGEGKPFFLAFDNDEAGNNAAKIFKESLVDKIGQPKFDEYVKQGLLKRHRARHGKDWNEDLEFFTKQALQNAEISSPKP